MTVEQIIFKNKIANPWVIVETDERVVSTNDVATFAHRVVIKVYQIKDRTYLFL